MAVTIPVTGTLSAGKKTPTDREKFIGTWKATVTSKDDRIELGVFTFRDDGKFTLEREDFLDLAKGTYTAESGVFKVTVTDAVEGASLARGPWPVKAKSVSLKEIILELSEKDRTVLIQLARIPVPEGAWQAIERDRQNLQGTWEYVRTERDGKLVNDKDAPRSMTFKGEKIQVAGEKEYGIFTLSANRKLKAIQFRFSNGMGLANIFAYELDGDKLRICEPDRDFPEEFKTKGTKNRIDEFKRGKE
jgi:uncharacterized protein (TIGR03067 family)